jgi:DNA-directed RNA polymerase specialized sigma24 family protein
MTQQSSFIETENLRSALDWEELYRILPPYVRSCIRCVHVPAWRRQEYDLVNDIVQETVVRLFLHIQKSQHGEASLINSIRHFSKRVSNSCQKFVIMLCYL